MSYSFRSLQNNTTVPAMADNCGAFEELERGVYAAWMLLRAPFSQAPS